MFSCETQILIINICLIAIITSPIWGYLICRKEIEQKQANNKKKYIKDKTDKLIITVGKTKLEVAPKKLELELTWHDAIKHFKNNKDGWRLPTKDELNEMWLQLAKKKLGDFAYDAYYWSSSEFGIYYTWIQGFLNGNQYYDNKYFDLYVRAVRVLSI